MFQRGNNMIAPATIEKKDDANYIFVRADNFKENCRLPDDSYDVSTCTSKYQNLNKRALK